MRTQSRNAVVRGCIVILSVFKLEAGAKWNEIVESFECWDVYYLREYVDSLRVHGDGEPLLLLYEDPQVRFCYVVMMSDIAFAPVFQGRLEEGVLYDLETPYGYGGPLCDSMIPDASQQNFLAEFDEYCIANGIVSQFVRFHPLLGNHDLLPAAIQTRYLHDTVYIDTSDKDGIFSNMDSKNRNMVRKAIRNGVHIEAAPLADRSRFVELYNATMMRDDADSYYYFSEDYFKALEKLGDRAQLFYAIYEGEAISASIMLLNQRFMHYHLSGSSYEPRSLAPSTLLLYEAALWAGEHGIATFHLGGGLTGEDDLFRFKKKFNKNGRLPFFIGRTITNEGAYSKLLSLRQSFDREFDAGNARMIQYRA